MTTWTGQMIASDRERDCAPRFRKEYSLDEGHGDVTSARLLATALGICEVTLNGRQVAEDLLTPGWTSYEWRLRYAEWDVTDLITTVGVIGATVGHGWHSGRLGFMGGRALYGDQRAVLVELHIAFQDGHTQIIATDDTWRSGPSEILADDLYDGETIDARLIDPFWSTSDASLSAWSGVRVLEFDTARLTPYIAPPVQRQETRAPHKIWTSPSGRTLIDFGQNLVGWLRLTVTGTAGQTITLQHAEVLEHGELGIRPLRTARATDKFILSGDNHEFEPRFTFHGFRYAEIDGWQGTAEELSAAIVAVVISSDLRRTGTFECSEPMLNQLHENIVWGMRGNFVDVPTDCPQRDERLGWTGDIAAFAPTAAYLYDVDTFLQDWLLDLAVEQENAGNGMIPVYVPNPSKYEAQTGFFGAVDEGWEMPLIALWNDAACWVPWAAWYAYGNRDALAAAYPAMVQYAERIAEALSERGLMESGTQLGDWLDPTAPPDNPLAAKANPFVIATECVYRSAVIAGAAATELGDHKKATEFSALATRIRTAFNQHWVTDGFIESDAAAVYALAIVFNLLDETERQVAGDHLAELVKEGGHRILTGFAGTPFINEALTVTGHLDTAYRLLMQKECPSWLYPVTMGATTVWERWDAMLPDGTINPGEMTSFNHYALGAVGDWMHRTIGGITPLEPGYRTILIAPKPGGGITWARSSLQTPHGEIQTRWDIKGGDLTLDAKIPTGTNAVIRLPHHHDVRVTSGVHHLVLNLNPVPAATERQKHEVLSRLPQLGNNQDQGPYERTFI